MLFYGLNKLAISGFSEVVVEDGCEYYKFVVGSPVMISVLKKSDRNKLMSNVLCMDKDEDNFMRTYMPVNTILFERDFVDGDISDLSCSCQVDDGSLRVGFLESFPVKDGMLSFSGVLDRDGEVDSDLLIYSGKMVNSVTLDNVRVLSAGMRDGELFGLMFVPAIKGLAVGRRGWQDCVSSVTARVIQAENWKGYPFEKWFEGMLVMEV